MTKQQMKSKKEILKRYKEHRISFEETQILLESKLQDGLEEEIGTACEELKGNKDLLSELRSLRQYLIALD